MVTSDHEREIALWRAFERLDHAYLIHDDDAARTELTIVERLRRDAADAASPRPGSSIVDAVVARVASTVDRLVHMAMVPAIVRSGQSGEASQADAALGEDERWSLGDRVELSAVVNGFELGVDVTGVSHQIEDRLRLFLGSQGETIEVPLELPFPEAGIVSATVPWSRGLPDEAVIVVLPAAPDEPAEPG